MAVLHRVYCTLLNSVLTGVCLSVSLSRDAVIWVCLLYVIVSFPRFCSICFCSHLAEEMRVSYFNCVPVAVTCVGLWTTIVAFTGHLTCFCSHLAEEKNR